MKFITIIFGVLCSSVEPEIVPAQIKVVTNSENFTQIVSEGNQVEEGEDHEVVETEPSMEPQSPSPLSNSSVDGGEKEGLANIHIRLTLLPVKHIECDAYIVAYIMHVS